MAVTMARTIAEALKTAAITDTVSAVRLAAVESLETRARNFGEVHAVHALYYVSREGAEDAQVAALQALFRLAQS